MPKEPKYIDLMHPVLRETFRTLKNTETAMASAFSYEASERDLFLCNYPKCGMTWLQYIVWSILHDGNPPKNKLGNNIASLEMDGKAKVEEIDEKGKYNIIKTHFPYKWLPKHPKAKYIFIARNPKDVCVSLYYHTKGFDELEFCDGEFDDFYDVFLRGKAEVCDYFQMLKDYYSHRNDSSLLFLLYEDLITEPKREIMKIAEFLGEEYAEQLKTNDGKLLDKVLRETSFSTMQKKTDLMTERIRPEGLPFVRKGIIGDWKNHMTKDQALQLDDKLVEVSQKSGCETLWSKFPQCRNI